MRRSLEWLAPGLGLKRWILLALRRRRPAGVLRHLRHRRALVAAAHARPRHGLAREPALGGAAALGRRRGRGPVRAAYGARRVWLFQKTTPESAGEIRAASRLARGPRVVAVGGGNGLAALLRGLKSHTSNLTAVVTMADDGGSSGLLRRDMGMPPPGDLRNCLVALADDESMMSQLFKYRFPEDGGLQGHSFGNLFMAALSEVTGDFEHAVREATHVLKVRGRVLPSTLDDVVLHAQLEGGGQVSGESTITAAERLPRRVWLTPEAPRGVPQAVAAIARADLVVLGPGSLYTSVIPNALVPQVREALADTRAWVVYVCNVMTEPGETDGYTAGDHLDALHRHGLAGMIDAILVNDAPVSDEMLASYERFGARPVVVDDDRLKALGVKVVRAPVATEIGVVRHDSERLSQALVRAREVEAVGFTRDVKLELVTVMPVADHCRRAQLSGLLFGAGVFEILAGGHYGVRVSTGLPAVARHLLALLKPLHVDASLRTVGQRADRAAVRGAARGRGPRPAGAQRAGRALRRAQRADDRCRAGWSSGAAASSPSCAGSSSAAGRCRRRARRSTPSSPWRTRTSPSRSSACSRGWTCRSR